MWRDYLSRTALSHDYTTIRTYPTTIPSSWSITRKSCRRMFLVPRNVLHMQKGNIVVIRTVNTFWLCSHIIRVASTRNKLKAWNRPHLTEMFLEGKQRSISILNEWFWERIHFIIPLLKFFGDILRKGVFEQTIFAWIQSPDTCFSMDAVGST